jgi:hypothetical protein
MLQMSLELVSAHHNAAGSLDRFLAHKGEVAEAKMRQQSRLCASLDARLQAAHATIDASAASTRDWLGAAETLLQVLARQLSGVEAMPGALAPAYTHQQHLLG